MLLLQEADRNGEALPKSAICRIRAVVTQQKPGNRQWALRWPLRQKTWRAELAYAFGSVSCLSWMAGGA